MVASSRRSRTTCWASTDKYGLRRYIRFGAHVDRAHWDDDEMRWHVFTKDGREFVAQFLISGAGGLHIPLIPEFEGLDDFAGAAFHSAQWDHSVDITGKRVAVIGTGASAIQIVPEIVKDVAALQLYQRTPAWVMPRPNNPFPQWHAADVHLRPRRPGRDAGSHLLDPRGRRLRDDAAAPAAQDRRAAGQVEHPALVKDRRLRRKLTPNYRAGCKRILNSDTYYRGIADPKTEVDHRPHRAVHRRRHRHRATAPSDPVDVVVFATGFHVTDSYTYVDIKGPAAKTWSTGGTARASRRTAASPSPTCRTCSSCSARTPRSGTTPWCS